MVALSVAIHTLFLYGVQIKLKRVDEPPRLTLNATIAAPQRDAAPAAQSAAPKSQPIKPVEAPAPLIKPAATKPAAKPSRKKASAPEPMARGGPGPRPPRRPAPHPVAERTLAMPVPETAPDMAPSPVSVATQPLETITATPPPEPAPPPSMATIRERSGAKLRAPTAVENPTLPADDVLVAPPLAAAEPSPAPLPAIATAPHPLEPIAQDAPPPAATSEVENTASAKPEPPFAAPLPPTVLEAHKTPAVAPETPPPAAEIAKAMPSISAPPAPTPSAMIDPNILPLPAAGEARYKLRMGLVSGELILSWNFADGHYRLNSVAQGTGIFAIAGKYVQASEGDITTDGLRPAAFSVERRGKKDSATFNWPNNSVQFNGKSGEHTEPVSAGAQDMLSLLFQLAFTPPLGEDLNVIVTNGRKLERYYFERAGEESLGIEGGTFRTLKILKQRKGDEDGMEVWLALEHHYLPVKIRVTDKKGSVIEQSLMAMKVLSAQH